MYISIYNCVVFASIVFGVASALAWLRSSSVKISHEKAMAVRRRNAELKGVTPNLASISFDGWDMAATFAAQSKWGSIGALLAACAVGLQALGQVLSNV
ncbi:hypothetical protein D3C71_1158310 [compost metagenome]